MSWFDIGAWLDGLGHLDPAVIYLVIGGLALLESAALVGLFVPGETAVLLGGVLAHEGSVNVVAMIAVVAIGAVIGDSISYEIGRRAGPWLAGSRLGRLLGEERLDAGRRYLQRRGAKAVFLGRFVAVVRTGVPLLAGVSRMRYGASNSSSTGPASSASA
jgi:membrane-associated protein